VLRGIAEVVIIVLAFSWWLIPFVAVGAYLWLHRRRTTVAATP
jgi:antibiotic biosynthesis monooxygenase (ABM) superfamily enzyme